MKLNLILFICLIMFIIMSSSCAIALPDLRVLNQDIIPNEWWAGSTLTVTNTVYNDTNVNTGFFYAYIYIRKGDGDYEQVGLPWRWPDGLPAFSYSRCSEQFTLPNGSYTIRFVADPENNIRELDENNNVHSESFTVHGGQPDLAIEYMNVPSSPIAGETFTVETRISNVGWEDITGQFTARLYVDGEQKTWWRWDTGLRSQWGSILNYNLTLPNGTHTIRLVVDPENSVGESNEGNNERSETRTWTGGQPELNIEYMNVPSDPIAGETFRFEARVKNIGWEDITGQFNVRLYADGEEKALWRLDGLRSQWYNTMWKDLALPSGTHTLRLVVDPENSVAESNEGNNERSEIRTWTGGQPELTIEYMNVPSDPRAGEPFTIEARIKNIGWEDITGQFTARLYVDGEQKAWWQLNGLRSQWYYTLTKELTLPNGTHIIRLVADPENSVAESNEGNNERSETRTWTGGQPDLTIEYMNVPSNPGAGEPFTIEARIKNIGWEDITGQFTARLYVDGEQKTWWRWDTGLRSQWGSTLSYNLTLPNGTHTIRLVVDLENSVEESNEGNNERSETRTCLGGLPDLSVVYMRIPNNLIAGVPFNIDARIENIGADDVTDIFYGRLYVDDIQIYSCIWVTGMRMGNHTLINVGVTLTAGMHTIRLVVDSGNNVQESDEENNILALTPICTGGQPDLSIIYMNIPDSLSAGEPFHFEAKIENIGWADAARDFYAYLFVNDRSMGSWSWIEGMRAGNSDIFSTDITLPAGEYTFELIIDRENNIHESNESNNQLSVSRICYGGQPDLAISFIDIPENPVAGEPCEFRAMIENIGWADVSGTFYARLYVDDVLESSWVWERLEARHYSVIETELRLIAGEHTLLLVVDSEDYISEIDDEYNNEMSMTQTWTGGSVDFTVSRLDEPSSAIAGVPFEITARVENIGWASASFTTRAILYIDDVPRVYWEWSGYSALSYSELSTSPVNLQLPAGPHIFRLKMDADNIVEEPYEENNEMSRTVIFTGAPSAPTGLDGNAGPGSGQVTLRWNSNPETDIAYCRIYRGATSGNYNFYYDRIPKEWNSGIIISGLTNGIIYYFSVTAINTMELESDFSNEVSITPIIHGDAELPTVPANLHIFDPETGDSLEISWSPSQDNVEVSHYLLYRLTNSSAVSTINYDSGFPITITQTEFLDTNVRERNTYYYKVQAVDSSGNRSVLSNIAFDDPSDLLAPSYPPNLRLIPGDGNVRLSWDVPASNSDGSALRDLVGYNIYRRESSGTYNTLPITGTIPGVATTYLDRGLSNGTTYYYVITATDDSGNESVYSPEVSATPETTDPPPNPPTNVVLISRAFELALFWNANSEPDIAGYNIYRRIEGEDYSIPLNPTPVTNTTYIDQDIDPTVIYFYVIRSIDVSGQESGNSNEVFGRVGTGALWLISPTVQLPTVLDFDTQTNPNVTILYYLDSNYLNLFPQGAGIKLEIINMNNQVVYTVWDYDPHGSGASFNPHFIWNGKDMDGIIINEGFYSIRISLFSNNQGQEALLWDRQDNAVRVINSGIRVAQVNPNESTKILISTLHDNDYPSGFQTEDRKIRIEAVVQPAMPNADVYFRVFDPDDRSSYEIDTLGDDNRDSSMTRGNLMIAPGYTLIPGSQIFDGNGRIIELGVKTDAQGIAKVNLLITNRYAGDNYIVRADTNPNPGDDNLGTGPLVAWKRIYIEEDYMYKVGTDLTADFIPDADNNPDNIQVQDTASLSVGDTIIVFDADHPVGETARITARTANTLTLDIDLRNTYRIGYTYPSSRGAAVARPSDGVYDANIEGRTPDTYGALIDGSDGGCFVEIKKLPDGSGNVPYRMEFPGDDRFGTLLTTYSNIWFKNIGKDNYIYVVGAANYEVRRENTTLGVALSSRNWIFIFDEKIKFNYPVGFDIANAESTAHEIGHQFRLTQVDDNHPVRIWCHLGPNPNTDYCIMGYGLDANGVWWSSDRTDEYSEFCFENPNHIYQTRDQYDGL